MIGVSSIVHRKSEASSAAARIIETALSALTHAAPSLTDTTLLVDCRIGFFLVGQNFSFALDDFVVVEVVDPILVVVWIWRHLAIFCNVVKPDSTLPEKGDRVSIHPFLVPLFPLKIVI
jgi:hypothetical protein